MENEQIPLSLEEYASLKKELRNQYITSISLSLLVIGLLHCMFYVKFGQFTFPQYEILILAAMLLISGFLTMKLTETIRKEISMGYKIIEHKPIEEKYSYDDREYIGGALFKKNVVVAGGVKYFTDKKVFDKAQIPGLLSIHLSPLRFKILRLES